MRISPVNNFNNQRIDYSRHQNISLKGASKVAPTVLNNMEKRFLTYLSALLLITLPFCKKEESNIPKNKVNFEVDGKDTLQKCIAQGIRLDIFDNDNPKQYISGLGGIIDRATFEKINSPIKITNDEFKILEALENNDGKSGISYEDIEIAVNQRNQRKLNKDLAEKDVLINSASYDEYAKTLNIRPQYRKFAIGLDDFVAKDYYNKYTNVLIAEGAETRSLPRLGNAFPFVKQNLGAPMIFRDSEGNIQRIFYASNMDYLDKESMEFCYYPNGKIRSIVACDSNDVVSKKDNMPAHEYARMEFDEEGFATYAYCENHPIVVETKSSYGLRFRKTINPGEVYRK